MSSRILRKLQGDNKDVVEDVSDPETDIPVSGGARRKQFNINRYDLLNQQSHSESEVKEDDNETEANNACEGDVIQEVKKKKKKKKKKSTKHVHNERSSEDNADRDEVERSVREVNRILGEPQLTTTMSAAKRHYKKKSILDVQKIYLNHNYEMKKIFGFNIYKESTYVKKPHPSNNIPWLVLSSVKSLWPPISRNGLSMDMCRNVKNLEHIVEMNPSTSITYFTYEHNEHYRSIQKKFLEAVETLNPDNILAILKEHPYHVDSLIQLSDLCNLSGDYSMARDFIARALYALEYNFHPFFRLTDVGHRIYYKRQENRAFFITLFKHLKFVGASSFNRTALELCKLLFSLDPDEDPLAVVLIIDFYAIRAKEYNWLIQFAEEYESSKNLSQLPNFAFSLAMAHYLIQKNGEEDYTLADQLLQDALIMFPGVLMPLLQEISVTIDEHKFFTDPKELKQSAALNQLIQLYVQRNCHLWKENNIVKWLKSNVAHVIDRVNRKDKVIEKFKAKRAMRYQGSLPVNIARHIILSDIQGLTPIVDGFSGPVLSFDPLPPKDSEDIYKKVEKPRVTSNNSVPFGIFFRSILPSFNLHQIHDELLEVALEEGAHALPENNPRYGDDLRRSVDSLVGAMRDLLRNIRPQTPEDQPNNYDVDESSSSS